MLTRLRRLLVPVFVVSIAAGGLAYAAVEDNPPVDLVEDTADETTAPTDEPSDEEVIPDVGVVDEPIADDGGAELTPVSEPETLHGPERSTQGCSEGFSGRNHGQYVSGTEDTPRNEAAKSDCGKPVHSDDTDEPPAEDDDSAPAPEGS